MSTIFSEIIEGKIPANIIYEDDNLFAIEDKYPQAPVHLLIITKKVIPNLQSIEIDDLWLVQEIVKCAQNLAKQYKVEKDYRLLTNNGSLAGQTIFHLHFHLIGGRRLGGMA